MVGLHISKLDLVHLIEFLGRSFKIVSCELLDTAFSILPRDTPEFLPFLRI
jgi:hypothetical protein